MKIDNENKTDNIFELIADSSTHHILEEIDAMLCDHSDYNEWMGLKSVNNLSDELRHNILSQIQQYWEKSVRENKGY